MTADHVVPLAYGGQTTMDNLVAAWMECNASEY
jgi:5-methylcytosine-specific restriction endonuclease McrA